MVSNKLPTTVVPLQFGAEPLGLSVMILHDFWPFASYVRSTMADAKVTGFV